MNFFEKIFFPWNASCINCNSEKPEKYGLCKKCYGLLSTLEGNRCEICLDRIDTVGLCKECLHEKPDYLRLYCDYEFSGTMRKLIHKFKIGNCRYLKYPFGEILLKSLPNDILNKCDVIVPVPSSRERMKKFGYNQALLLANELSKLTGLPVNNKTISKKSGQTKMALLNKEQRRKNIKGLYELCGEIGNKTVLLVDDICTTGETLRYCARLLKKAGASKVYAVAIARTELKY